MRRAAASTLVGLVTFVTGSGTLSQQPSSGSLASPVPTAADVRGLLARGHYAEAKAAARACLAVESSRDETSLAAAEAMDLVVEVLSAAGFSGTQESVELAERALAIKEHRLGWSSPGYAWSLALAADGDANPSQGAERLSRALELEEQALGAEPLRLAWMLHHRGIARDSCSNEPGRAGADIERAWHIRERELGPMHPDTLESLMALLGRRDPTACIEHLTDVLATLEREGRGADPIAAELWRYVAHCQGMKGGEFTPIRAAFERALAIDLERLGPRSPYTAADQLGLGMWYASKLEPESAARYLEPALQTVEDVFGRGSRRTLPWVQGLARYAMIFDIGDTDALVRDALALRANAFGNDCPDYIDLLLDYAAWLKNRGECPQARALLEPAIELLERHRASGTLATGLHYLGEVLACMGDGPRALAQLERSVELIEQQGGPDSLPLWVVLADLGDVNTRLGNYAVAEAQLQRSIALLERYIGLDYGGVATDLRLLGENYAARQAWEQALGTLDRALGVAEKAFGKRGKRTAYVLRDLCSVQLARGELDAAQESCGRALDIALETQGARHPNCIEMATQLGAVRLAQGARAAARTRAVEAEEGARNYFLRTARHLSEREALGLEETRPTGLDVALSTLTDPREVPSPDAVSLVWDQVVRSRALVLDEVALRHEVSLREEGQVRDRARRLESARDALSRLIVRSMAPDWKGKPAQVEEAFAAVDVAERELAATDAVFGQSVARTRTALAEVLSTLPAEAALVSYVKYRRMAPSPPFGWTPSYLAFVQAPGRAGPSAVDLGSAAHIEGLVAAWRHELDSPPPPGGGLARDSSYLRAGTALREAIWDPLRGLLAQTDLALVIPDGALHLVSLMTLPVGPERFVVEDAPVLHLLSAERDVAALSHPAATGQGLLLVGAPDFNLAPDAVEVGERRTLSSMPSSVSAAPVYRGPSPSCSALSSEALQPLPRTLAEVERVASIWSAREPGAAPVIKLVEDQAGEGAFKRLVRGRRLVHLATHGFFGDAKCLAGVDPSPIESRLLISGLAFAGAGRRAEAGPDQEDGILTADEIASLDMTSAEWVVLSACDSGVGRSVDGEGVLGLRRAFQTAGARTLVMSLWRVQDEAASQWMTRLYRARAQHESTAHAVRDATLELLATRRERGLDTHPYYWGAFVAAGDWR